MRTIENKKGNKGYVASCWNCTPYVNGLLFPLNESAERKSIEFIVRPIEIMSCGKKQMTAVYLDENKFAKHFFQPDTKVFETYADAVLWCKERFKQHLEVAKIVFPDVYPLELDRLKNGLKANPQHAENWQRGLDVLRANHARFQKKEYSVVVFNEIGSARAAEQQTTRV